MGGNQYDNKQWGVADFKRYHSQQMSNEERHALEKAALDDPFLEDALDGYALANSPEKDLAYLKEKIQPEKDQGKTIPFSYRPYRWLKIAAILILVAGLTWLMYPTPKKDLPQLAQNKSASAPTKDVSPTVTAPATTTETEPQTAAPATAAAPPAGSRLEATAPIIAAPDKNALPKDVAVNDDKLQQETRMTEEAFDRKEMNEDAAKAAPSKAKMDMIVANQIKGRVVDNQGAPVPYATVSVPQSNVKVAADVNGEFSLANNQQNNVTANVNAPGFEPAQAALNASNTENKIVLQESDQTLAEVVTSGYGQARKKSTTASATQVTALPERVKLTNVRLLRQNEQSLDSVKKLITQLPAPDTTGYVQLRFLIGRLGNATNIEVIKPLCKPCDAAAITLLKELPPLRRVGTSKPYITIHF